MLKLMSDITQIMNQEFDNLGIELAEKTSFYFFKIQVLNCFDDSCSMLVKARIHFRSLNTKQILYS